MPFCPIYGVGALQFIFLLRRYESNTLLLFIYGSVLATTLEFLTALLMLRIFGDFWWDYKEKPFNYKGILCVESSIAWGFYTVFLFGFLQKMVVSFVKGIPLLLEKLPKYFDTCISGEIFSAVSMKKRSCVFP